MKAHHLALHCAGALLVLASATGCEGGSRSSCVNGDCTVVVGGTQASGDLSESMNAEYEFLIRMGDDRSATVTVVLEQGNRESGEDATLQPGESAELNDYTVEYVSDTEEDGATFEFTGS
jgi:hypothetical protein